MYEKRGIYEGCREKHLGRSGYRFKEEHCPMDRTWRVAHN
jgi:hypothetical protein